MTTQDHEWLTVLVVLVLIIGLFAVAHQCDQLKIEAVKHGAAEWIVDDEGKTTFQWKTKQ